MLNSRGCRQFGRYDVVVNNAGYGNMAAVEDMTLVDFKEQMDTNFFGVVYVCKAVVPFPRKQGFGHIFQVSSHNLWVTAVSNLKVDQDEIRPDTAIAVIGPFTAKRMVGIFGGQLLVFSDAALLSHVYSRV